MAWQMDRRDPVLTYQGHRLVVTAIDLNEGEMECQYVIFLARHNFLCFMHRPKLACR